MATITILEARGALIRVTVPLGPGEDELREIYGFPELIAWMRHTLPRLVAGRLRAADSPKEQFDNMLYRWNAGKMIIHGRMFKDLMPMADEVWEQKTADLRMFGWMYRPRIFIGVFADYADDYKGKRAKKNYGDAKKRVLEARERIDLDEPKFQKGKFDELVCL
jgi:hypothetical protein